MTRPTSSNASRESPAVTDLEGLSRLLRPRRIAVVGASRNEQHVGGLLLRNLLRGGFAGEVYPVNPKASEIQGQPAYARISACPTVPDLAIIAVPAEMVPDVVEEAGRVGVAAVCVISAGFAEAGDEGARRAQELLKTVHRHGMRMIGPNCMGLLNAADDVRMNATFSPTFPKRGRVGMLSQSGALGLAVLDHAEERNLGLSTFVSVGNTLDLTASELLQYWEQDADTDVLLLYLESLGDAREFHRQARRIARKKPIVVVKSGRTAAGERAASSHTAALAGRDTAADALFSQSGVIRTDTLREMFEMTELLVSQRIPRGHRVAIITNGGGPGIMAADACQAHGLEVPALGEAVQAELEKRLPEAAAVSNPVDILAGGDAAAYEHALKTVGTSGEVDVLLTIFIPPIVTEPVDVANSLVRAQRMLPSDLPIVGVFMGRNGPPQPLVDASIPVYPFPEEAARAIGRAARWSAWRSRTPEEPVRPAGIDEPRARAVVRQALQRDVPDDDPSLWMTTSEATELLDAYGVPLAESRFVSDAAAAADAQRAFDAPVAVKVDAPIHKTDVGGVVLGCKTPEEAAEAVEQIAESLQQADQRDYAGGYLVQKMIEGGVEFAVGVREAPVFGPVLMVGLGGELLELLGDVCLGLPPLSQREAREMLESLKSYPLLRGYRGQPARDTEALLDLIHRVGALAEDLDVLAELDLNPVFVKTEGVVAADVRLRRRSAAAGK